jgi:hypothetical protein
MPYAVFYVLLGSTGYIDMLSHCLLRASFAYACGLDLAAGRTQSRAHLLPTCSFLVWSSEHRSPEAVLDTFSASSAQLAASSSSNGTDLRPPNRTPSPARETAHRGACTRHHSRDGRAGRAPLAPRRAPGAPKCARRPCNDTQEIANSFWSYFYGGSS